MSASSYEAPSSASASDVQVNKAGGSLIAARRVLADLVASGDPAVNIQSALSILGPASLQRHGLVCFGLGAVSGPDRSVP